MLLNLFTLSFLVGVVLLLVPLLADTADPNYVDPGHPTAAALRPGLLAAKYFPLLFGTLGLAFVKFIALAPDSAAWAALAISLVLTGGTAGVLIWWRRKAIHDRRDRSLHGALAIVISPITVAGNGRIAAQQGAQRIELHALPFDLAAPDAASWTTVRIIDVRNGIALVRAAPDSPE